MTCSELLRRGRSVVEESGVPGSVGRLGGDEFLALIAASQDAVDGLARSIVAAIEQPIEVSIGRTTILTRVGASVGIAVSTESTAIADLLRLGDQAMYRGKSRGKNRWARSDELAGRT